MHSLDIKEISKNNLILFMLCENYPLSYGKISYLYNISDKYFWSILNSVGPLLKVGMRKFSQLSVSSENILSYINSSNRILSEVENNTFSNFLLFLANCFYNGKKLYRLQDLKDVYFKYGPEAYKKGYASTFSFLVRHYSEIDYILIAGEKYYRTSLISYLIEKYYGHLTANEIDNMTVQQLINLLEEVKCERSVN